MTKAGSAVSATVARRVVPAGARFRLPLERLDAVLFDLDKVVIDSGASLAVQDSHAAEGVTAFADAVGLVALLRELGVPAAAVTSFRDGGQMLTAAGVGGLFTVVVDGGDAEREGLAGLPDPAVLVHAAHLLRVHPARAAVVHAAAVGVQAACRGGLGLVVGVDRRGGREAELRTHGAEARLTSLDSVTVDTDAARRLWWQPPQAVDPGAEHAGWLLDYTGVDPDSEGIRETLCTLGNGYLATRGAAPETGAGAVHYPGTYAAGLFNRLLSRVGGGVRRLPRPVPGTSAWSRARCCAANPPSGLSNCPGTAPAASSSTPPSPVTSTRPGRCSSASAGSRRSPPPRPSSSGEPPGRRPANRRPANGGAGRHGTPTNRSQKL